MEFHRPEEKRIKKGSKRVDNAGFTREGQMVDESP